MSDFLDDYATTRVPEDRTVSGVRIGMINGALCFALPGLVAGVQIGGSLGLARGIKVFLIGGLFLSVIGTIVGIIGVRNRVSSYMLTQFMFGRAGAVFMNFAIAVALLGWYGVNMDLLGATVQLICEQLFAISPPAWAVEVFAGIVMTVTAIFGFRLLNQAASYAVPFLFLLTLYIGIKSLAAFNGDLQLAVAGSPPMTDGEEVTAVAGGFIVSAVLMSDFSRFARADTDAATAAFLPFLGLSSFAYIAAALAAIVFQESDILLVMLALGLGIGALALIFVSAWITNVVNLYSCSLSLSAVFKQQEQWHLTVVAGILATGAALMNILDAYTSFLFGLSIIFAPIGGIFIVEFYVLRNMQPYELDTELNGPFRPAAAFAWAVGTGMAMLANNSVVTLTGFEVADALLSAGVAYLVLAWSTSANLRRKATS
jgi:cytosine permease